MEEQNNQFFKKQDIEKKEEKNNLKKPIPKIAIAISAALFALLIAIVLLVVFLPNSPSSYLEFESYYPNYTVVGLKDKNREEIVIPAKYKGKEVTKIDDYAFKDSTNLKKITIGNNVRYIEDNVFLGCDSLTEIILPNSIREIDSYAFTSIDSLKFNEYDNAYYLGNESNPYIALIKVKNRDIENCNIHSDTITIAADAFKNCQNIKQITIPDSVICIGEDAFYNCDNLESVSIGKGLEEMVAAVFGCCAKLRKITYSGTTSEWNEIYKWKGSSVNNWNFSLDDCYVYCTNGEINCEWDGANGSSNGSSSSNKCNHQSCKEYGPFPCYGKNNTCPNYTYCYQDLYCNECD